MHFKDNIMPILYYSLSTMTHTHISLPQSHFAEWFCLLLRIFSQIFLAMSGFTASQYWHLLPAMLIFHLDNGNWIGVAVGNHCQIYCKLFVFLKALKPCWRDLEQKTKSWTSWCVLVTFPQILPAHFHCKTLCRCEPGDFGETEMLLLLV